MENTRKKSQKVRVLELLQSKPKVSCYEFVTLSPMILNYRTRIFELRAEGHNIPAPKITWVDGQKHSTYTYVNS